MSLVSDSIPNLINGVSQQPSSLRLPTQAEDSVNYYGTVVEGLRKRPPTEHIARIITGSLANAHIHVIDRDETDTDKFIAIFTNGDLRVFDLTGVERTVAFPDGKAYLNSADPKFGFRCMTVADYTFVVNIANNSAMDAATKAARQKEALINVRAGQYGRTYQISIDGVSRASYTTSTTSVSDLDTSNIATQIANQLTSNLGVGWTITRFGHVVHVQKTTGDFAISSQDGDGGDSMIAIKGTVQRFGQLPTKGPSGFTVEVEGEATEDSDNYFVEFVKQNAQDSDGVWKETLKEGSKLRFNAATMPHVLIRESNGTFTFKRATWIDRKVGDDVSNPEPSFIGKPFSDVFFYKNRLGLIADENVIMSEVGEFFNFFRTTVTTLLDSDPIDIAVPHTKVSILNHAFPYSEDLWLFSNKTQFRLKSNALLSPKDNEIVPVTEFDASADCRPLTLGQSILFPFANGDYMGVREMYLEADTDNIADAEVTAHVPQYIPNGVFKMTGTTNSDTVCLLTTEEENAIYVYKYFWSGKEKLQSAWMKFEFPTNVKVLNVEFVDSRLILLTQRPDGVCIETMDMKAAITDPGAEYVTCIDRRIPETRFFSRTYDAVTNRTTITVPYFDNTDGTLEVVSRVRVGSQTISPGVRFSILSESVVSNRHVLVISGQHETSPLWVGKRYTSRHRMSPFYMRKPSGNGQLAIQSGRLQIRRVTLVYNKTATFKVEVTPRGRDKRTYTFTGRILGSNENVLGSVAIEEGKFRFPVMTENVQATIDIVNDSPFPCAFQGAEWEGFFTVRSQVR